MSERLNRVRASDLITWTLILACLVMAVVVGFLVSCDPRLLIPPAPPTRAPTLTSTLQVPDTVPPTWTNEPTITQAPSMTPTPTMTHTSTATATLEPSRTATVSPTPFFTVTPTPINTVTPWRNGTMPTTGAPSASNAWLVIFGTVLLALGAWLFDASAQLPHTVGADE